MLKKIAQSSLISLGLLFFIIAVFKPTPVSAINKETRFPAKEAYEFLFEEGLGIVKKNITGEVVVGHKGFTYQPRLKASSKPRYVEYTTFYFDGYWDKRPWERRALGERQFWDWRKKRIVEKEKIPGRWCFKVKWTTKEKYSKEQGGKVTIVQFEQVLPEVTFLRYGPTQTPHTFKIKELLPDKEHERRGYIHGVFGVWKDNESKSKIKGK